MTPPHVWKNVLGHRAHYSLRQETNCAFCGKNPPGTGVTEVIYQPTGPDIPGELQAFITAARPVLTRA